jgi:hypothetical protein
MHSAPQANSIERFTVFFNKDKARSPYPQEKIGGCAFVQHTPRSTLELPVNVVHKRK